MQPRFILILWLLLVFIGCSNQKKHHDSEKESGFTDTSQETAKEDDPNNLCETIGKDQCASYCMSRKGAKLNLEGRCHIIEEFCMKYAYACGQTITYAQDHAGNYWISGDNCLPSNFKSPFDSISQTPGQVDVSDAYNWPLCSP